MTGSSDETPSGSLIRPFLTEPSLAPPATPTPAATTPAASGTSIRPYLVTAGRTADAGAIPVETQVIATSQGEGAVDSLTFEYRDIVSLCTEPVAVAELAARLSLHLGVIRVLVTDLQQQGLVITYRPQVDPAEDIDMIVRVINGLRRRA